MRPAPGEVLHFSEDPTITRFVPHVAATAQVPDPYVWAVDADNSPHYWFPRQCPRAMAWVADHTTPENRDRVIGPGGGDRVHAIEYPWLPAMLTTQLYAYRLPADRFTPVGDGSFSPHVATEPVDPLGPPLPVGNLVELHAEAGIQLRVLPGLYPFWHIVITTTLHFSGIRLRNAGRSPADFR